MNLEPITSADLRSGALRARAQVHAADEVTFLRVRDGSDEVGVVVLDFDSGDEDEVILVEIYVLTEFRRRGVGSEALTLAESWARDRGCAWMTLDAEPLDDDDDQAKERLIKWYQRRGYRGWYDHLGKRL